MGEAQEKQPEEPKMMTKPELINQMTMEFDVMMAKVNQYGNLPQREIQLCRTNLEQAFLWMRNAIDKAPVVQEAEQADA